VLALGVARSFLSYERRIARRVPLVPRLRVNQFSDDCIPASYASSRFIKPISAMARWSGLLASEMTARACATWRSCAMVESLCAASSQSS